MKVTGIKRGQSIEVSEILNIPDGAEVVVEIQEIKEPSRQPRPSLFGSEKGLIWISDDFDEPLEEFEEYM